MRGLRMTAFRGQKELATMMGTTQSVISHLEDADYEGHSLSMLSKIAQINHKIKIELIPITSDPEKAG